jgi:anti-sigma regulatory factor (Ser/Thr protein kinase)
MVGYSDLCEEKETAFGGAEPVQGSVSTDDGPEISQYAFVLPNDQARITSVVKFLSAEAIRVAASDETEQMRISLALEEALANALHHGNLEIDPNDADTAQRCRHDVALRRRSRQPYCNRRIRVLATIARRAAVFVVRDEGRGFDCSLLPDPTDDANLDRCSGRGVFLMRNLMDQVFFNEIGNEVTMIRHWAREDAQGGFMGSWAGRKSD